MPNLVAVDVSVSDDRINLVFSHGAVATAYAAYLETQDCRRSPMSGHRRDAQLQHGSPTSSLSSASSLSKEVSIALPNFITWFINCRMPDDEDSVTFTFIDSDEKLASSWAESMVLFERVSTSSDLLDNQEHDRGDDNDHDHDEDGVKQLHVRRLWNKTKLLKRLEELRKASTRRWDSSVLGDRESFPPPRNVQNMTDQSRDFDYWR
ncbi:hypothetical protein B0T17DRAFT_493272 [Bombardia bombarda]|uniref:Uncharacterized protein n=1 Tax=Bombardia bombarda TaxID=252184 RepID=A0AA40C4N3_9PEZI|nr:hypothetical protein B0T17DRAFT_493272 [Bombardia bombarda]